MRRRQETCGNCCGTGREIKWDFVFEDKENCIGTAQSREIICEHCNGKGYAEYIVFSVEEAELISKHCGLTMEN